MASKYTGYGTYNYQTRQPIASGGYFIGGSRVPSNSVAGIQASFGHPGTSPLGKSYYGAGQGPSSGGSRFTGPSQVVGGDDQQAWERQLWGLNYARQQNEMSRNAALGYLSPVSSSIAQLKQPLWGAGELNTARGLMEDRLSSSRTSQMRRLQDAAAQRGGTLGFSPQADLDRAHQQDLSSGVRELQINAIEKNRAALENAIAKEITLAGMQTSVIQSFPLSPEVKYDLPAQAQPIVQQQQGGGGFNMGSFSGGLGGRGGL